MMARFAMADGRTFMPNVLIHAVQGYVLSTCSPGKENMGDYATRNAKKVINILALIFVARLHSTAQSWDTGASLI